METIVLVMSASISTSFWMLVQKMNVCMTETMHMMISHSYLLVIVLETKSDAVGVEVITMSAITVKLCMLGELDNLKVTDPETQIISLPEGLDCFGNSGHIEIQQNAVGLMDERRLGQPAVLSDISVSSSQGHDLVHLNTTGVQLLERFWQQGDTVDQENAISNRTKAVELTEDNHPSKPGSLSNLGNSQQTCFEYLGDLADFKNAIFNQTKAVELTEDNHPSKPGCLSNLGNSQQTCFEYLGDLADLENAISNKTKVVELTNGGHPDKPKYLLNLGNSQQICFGCLGDLADFENTIPNKTKAVELTNDGHPYKPMYLSNVEVNPAKFDFQIYKDDRNNTLIIVCFAFVFFFITNILLYYHRLIIPMGVTSCSPLILLCGLLIVEHSAISMAMTIHMVYGHFFVAFSCLEPSWQSGIISF